MSGGHRIGSEEIEKFEYQLNHSTPGFSVWVKEALQNFEGMLGSN